MELRIQQFEENPDLRYSKIRRRTKRPLERNWPSRPYTYNVIQAYVRQFENYGVLCGHGGLVVPDADSPELEELIEKELPQTFTVRTGNGGKHYYFICPELERRIVLEHDGVHYGEIQSHGQLVVGPGSIHPNGNRYAVERNEPIQAIGYNELITPLKPFIKEKQKPVNPIIPVSTLPPGTSISSIPITSVIDISEFQRAANGELYGPNPWHGSQTGMNTWINEQKNIAYCFRHNTGITVAKAIALNEGITNECDDDLTKDQFIQTLQIAEVKYGLKQWSY